jgi:hypothetical protein
MLDRRHAKLSRPLRQRLVALDLGKGHLCLECRLVIASHSLHRLAPLVHLPRLRRNCCGETIVMLWELNVIAHRLNTRPRVASILPRPWKSIYNYVIINQLPWNL